MHNTIRNVFRSMHFKAAILGLVIAGAYLCAVASVTADTIGLNSDRPTVYKMRQEGDVLIVEFYVPTNYNAYHLIVNGAGQNGKQLEYGGNGWLSHKITNIRANAAYTVSVQGVRKASSIFSKDDCSPWDALKQTTHAIAQEITFLNHAPEPVDLTIYYQLNNKWHTKTLRLPKGILIDSVSHWTVLTDNTNLYYYAKGATTGIVWDGPHKVGGMSMGFRLYDTGNDWKARTITLKK